MGDTRKYRNIDALRTFGCLAIIAWHVKANTGFSTGGVLDKVIPSFDYLVYLFMIISGFGMCNGYYQKLKTGTYSIDAFYSKRYKRTVPFFALLILLNFVIEFTPKTVCEGLMEITMLFGFLPNNTLSTIGVAFVICGTAVVNSTIEAELKETASKLGVRIFLAGHRLDIPEILRRYEYTGALVMGRRKKIDVNTTSVRTLPEDKWIIAENAHAAIVTRDEYYQAQKAIRNVTPISI